MSHPVEVFFSYAHEDEELMNAVRQHLVIFDRQDIIRKWHDREIQAGTEWKNQIDNRLQRSDIVLLFISPAFFDSDYCFDIEMKEAMRRHDSKEVRVIPIILRPCSWQTAPFAHLQVLPTNGCPVSVWPNRDEGCLNVANGVMCVVREIRGESVVTGTVSVSPQGQISANLSRHNVRNEWMVYEAAFLWHGLEPPGIAAHFQRMPTEVEKTKEFLHQAVNNGTLKAREHRATDGLTRYVKREDLVNFAKKISERPDFLFPSVQKPM